MSRINEWGNVRLICPCGGDGLHKYHFQLEKQGGLIYYCCLNSKCRNSFSTDIHLKAMEKLNNWHEKHGTYEGFSFYFRVKDDSMRMKYIRTEKITEQYETVIIEVANLTKQPESRINRQV